MAGSLKLSIQSQFADLTECSICTEIFTNPKSLPCLHSFCLQCLEKYGKDKKTGDQMACPICRSNFVIPNGGFCNFQSNFFIGKMVEIRKLSSTTTGEALCATCPEEETVKAKMFCFECEQNLCERCGVTHSKMKLSQYHQVVEIGNKPQEVNSRNSYCDQHPGELVKMYCDDDKVTICFICFAESHQTHKCLSVTKASEEFSSALKNDFETVKRKLPECKDSLEKLKKLKTDLLTKTAETGKQILNEVTRLKALIDSHANIFMGKLIAIKDKKLKEIESTQQDVERIQATIESYTRYLDELLNKGAPGDICREANQMKTRAQELTAQPAICCGCECCWDNLTFKSSNLESVLRISNTANVIGNMETGSSNSQILGHAKAICLEDHLVTEVVKSPATGAISLEKQCRTVVVQNIPTAVSVDILRMEFENQSNGGGAIDEIDYKGEGTASVTFKDSSVADTLALKECLYIWALGGSMRLLIKKR